MAKKACWHLPVKKQLVLDVDSEQAVIHGLWISRGEEVITPTLSPPLSPPEAVPGWSPAVGHVLSHTSVLREPGKPSCSEAAAQARCHPPLAQLPTISTCLEQHPKKTPESSDLAVL